MESVTSNDMPNDMEEANSRINSDNESNSFNNNNDNLDAEEENDEDYDEFEMSQITSKRNLYQTQSRRVSVFSKSFDPESSDLDLRKKNDLNPINENDDSNGLNSQKTNDSFEDYEDDDSELEDDNLSSKKKRDSYCFETEQNKLFENDSKLKIKSQEQIQNLKQVLKSIVLFKHLYEDDIDLIVDSMFERKTNCDEVIIREGGPGNYFYVILNGHFEVYIKTKKTTKNTNLNDQNDDSEEKVKHHIEYGTKISEYKNKGYFGELY
jgi:hypothetical protein